MADYKVTYGGAGGKSYKLAVADDYVVVRTRKRAPLERTVLSARARQQVSGLDCVARYEEAGVEVYRCPGRGKQARDARNRVRSALKREAQVEFAGRVLCDRASHEPVVYTENFFIKFVDDIRASTCRTILRKLGLKSKRELSYAKNAYFAAAQEGTGLKIFSVANRALREKNVELCHPELIRTAPRREAFSEQWHLKRTTIDGNLIDQHANAEAAWDLTRGEGITIAVIDDGFDLQHEEFSGSLKITAPRDVTRGTDDPTPGNFDHHGTAVAGVACANGVHNASGVAPGARLMPIRLASALGSQNEADAFVWAADNGADIISCSWGPADGEWWNPSDPAHNQVVALPDSTRLALDHAVEQGRSGKGCVITWAAGNGNEPVGNDGYASYQRVIAVGACNDQGTRSAYSDTGDALWCCFPSSNGFASLTPGIWTTDRSGSLGYNPDDYTDDFGGTSSACPGAAGVAALILARNTDLRWDEVKDILRRSCDRIDVSGGSYDADGHSQQYGYGRVNARRAVDLALPAQPVYTAVHTAIQDVPIQDLKVSNLAIAVGDTKPIQQIVVRVDIEHTYVGDLIVRLAPPTGIGLGSVVLHDREGGGSDNLKRQYDVVSTPALSDFIGISAAGKWTLKVSDRAERDVGAIRQFSLELVV